MARIAALSGAGSFAQAVTTRARSGHDTTLIRESNRESARESLMFSPEIVGFESPSLRHSLQGNSDGDSRIDSRNPITSCPDLAQVVTAWAKLPAPLKSAILAIVRTTDSSK